MVVYLLNYPQISLAEQLTINWQLIKTPPINEGELWDFIDGIRILLWFLFLKRRTTKQYTRPPPQLYFKLHFYKYLHSSPSGFFSKVKSDRILSLVVNNADDKS